MLQWQGINSEGYWAHPALLDASTHVGAVYDTDSSWRDGTLSAPRVPVSLGAYNVPRLITSQVRYMLQRCNDSYSLSYLRFHLYTFCINTFCIGLVLNLQKYTPIVDASGALI